MSALDLILLILRYGGFAALVLGAAWALFRYLRKQWINQQFAKSLEAFKHAKNSEIEHLRGEVSALLDRTTKLHAMEFEVLPELWDKLSEAYGQAASVCSRGRSYPRLPPDFDRALEAFLAKSPLEDHEKAQIGTFAVYEDRKAYFEKTYFRHQLAEARRRQVEAHNYFVRKSIFIRTELKDKIAALSDLIWRALGERSLYEELPFDGTDRFVDADRLTKEGEELYREIGDAIQARLWDRKLLAEAPQLDGPLQDVR